MNLDIRKYTIGACIILIGMILLARVFYLQIIDDTYKISSDNNAQRWVTQYPARGQILDRNGQQIVTNQAAYDLMIIPKDVKTLDSVKLAKLAQLLNISVSDVQKNLNRLKPKRAKSLESYKPALFLKQLSSETYAVFQEHLYDYPGFFVQARTLRNYVRPIAPHALGYIAEVDTNDMKNAYYKMGDYIGKIGVEHFYEKELRGKKGVTIYNVDVKGQIKGNFLNGEMDTMAIVGSDLTLGIDADLQEYAEHLMGKMRGAAVAIEPSTGEILMMVSMPNYDPSLFVGRKRDDYFPGLQTDPSRPLFDRSVRAFYPPGSTFKVAQGLVGLQQGSLTPDTRYGCAGGYTVGNFHMGCHNHASPLNLAQAIGNSCNAYFANVFRRILDDKQLPVHENFNNWRKAIMSFGFGHRLGLDLPQELNGNVPTVKDYTGKFFPVPAAWRSLTIVSLAIGQAEMGSTVVQMANFAALIANGGYFYTPHLIKKIQSVDGQSAIPPQFTEKHFTEVDTSYFKTIQEGMALAVAGPGGTARWIAIPDIEMCGKTGTAQNPHGLSHSTFMAYAPRNNPKIAIAVYIENAGSGASWAAPIASLLIEKYLTGEVKRPWMEDRLLNFNLYNNHEAAN
ncbi:MAG: penicillin-binding protein 2 [Bacteroidales bacterium]|jgi:penicillin-binding protein 2|nr:penicillin-binding protein 2 [Bacteroidales bacterium]